MFACLALGGPAGASDADVTRIPALSLTEARAQARAHNAELRAAMQDVEIARGRLEKARLLSQFNPEIGAEGAHRERNEPGETGSTTDFSVWVSQEVEVAGQRRPRVREGEQNLARAESHLGDRRRLLDADVQRTFFRTIAGRRRVELLRTVEELGRRVRDAAAARVQAGESAPLEANLAAARYALARKETLTADAERAAALATLRRLLDLEFDAPIEATGELRPTVTEMSLPSAVERALIARPDLVAAMREAERAESQRDLVRRLAIPNPTIEVFHREEELGPDRITGAGLRIPLPIFDRRQGEITAATARAGQARFEIAALRRTVEQEVVEAYRRHDAARRALAVYDENVLARAAESLDFVEQSYRAGKINLFELAVVENDLVAAQLSYIATALQAREAAIDLESATGGAPEGETR